MEIFLFALLASLVDPVRWVICVLSGWFVPSLIGALATGVGVSLALTVVLTRHPSGSSLVAGAIASALVVSAFYLWRKGRRLRANAKAEAKEDAS